MKMNEQYLWDKSGAVDPEIDRLESALSELRFDPDARNLILPVASTRRPTWRRPPLLAIAAGVALMALCGTVWWQVERNRTDFIHSGSSVAISDAPFRQTILAKVLTPSENPGNNSVVHEVSPHTDGPVTRPRDRSMPRVIARTRRRSSSEVEEGERVKAELMLALRVAGEKLHSAQQQLGVNKPAGPAS